MDLTCPKCQHPTEGHGSLAEDGLLLSGCPTCHVNLILIRPEGGAIQPPAPGLHATTVAAPARSTPPGRIRLARGLSVTTFVVNLTLIGAIILGSVVAMKELYDPQDVDQHVLSPLLLRLNGWTGLHLAAARGDPEEVARLLADGAEIEATNGQGRTPLLEAAKRGHDRVVLALLDHGASPGWSGKHGRTAILEAAMHGHHAVLAVLLARGASPQDQDVNGNTALHLAAQSNREAIARQLLEAGVDANARDNNRETPLHVAARQSWHEHAAVASLLMEHGADLEAKDSQGFTPLIRASWYGHFPVFSELMLRRADPNARTHDGKSALYLAAQAGRYRIAATLLEQGADPNARCDCGGTPLHQAVHSGDERVVTLLLEHGARVNARVRGKTALQVAEERKLKATMVVLQERGGTTYPEIHDHVSRARELAKRKAYVKAAERYGQALALDPTDAELYYLRGSARLKAKQHAAAAEDFAQALALDPDRFRAYQKLASIFSLREDWDGIIARWDAFLARQPRHAGALYERGRAYFRKAALQHDAAARAQALADTLRSCELGYEEGCRTYANSTGKPAA